MTLKTIKTAASTTLLSLALMVTAAPSALAESSCNPCLQSCVPDNWTPVVVVVEAAGAVVMGLIMGIIDWI